MASFTMPDRLVDVYRRLADDCHPRQRDMVVDSAKRWTALVGARGGKTTGCRGRLVRRALDTPRAQLLYISTTEPQAEKLLWNPLKELDKRENLGCKFLESKLRCEFPHNGSWIQLGSAATKREIEAFRGIPHHEVIIDECGSHNPRLLSTLVHDIIVPRLADFGGALGLMGTPSNRLRGPFYDITGVGSKVKGWSRHAWCVRDVVLSNTDWPRRRSIPDWLSVMRRIWAEQLETKDDNGWSDDNPTWLRETLGQWASDDTERVFKYRRHDKGGALCNAWEPERDSRGLAILPEDGSWDYYFSLDEGHKDPMALTIWGGDEHTGELRQVYELQRPGMYARDLALVLLGPELDASRPGGIIGAIGWPFYFAGDIGEGLRAELKNVYGITIEKVERRDKHDYVELVNGDFIDRRMFLLLGCELEAQTQNLQWAVDDYGHLREHKGMPNHLTDTMIYARRGFRADHRGPDPADAERAAEQAKSWEDKSLEKLLSRGQQSDFASILAQAPTGDEFW